MVQAFHLPKNTHVTLPYVPPRARETPKLADELKEPATGHVRPEFIASNFIMMDIDSDTEEVVGLQPEQPQAHGHYYIPKTMQEMAEEHDATRRQQLGSDADDDFDDGEEATMASPQAPLAAKTTRKSEKQATVKIILPSEALVTASTSNNLSSSRSTKAKTNRKSSTTPNLKRKQRRPRKKVEEESDSADLTDEEDDKRSSPSKRARVHAAVKDKRPPVAITPSTRTLRPRISKTTAQIEEEKQDEND